MTVTLDDYADLRTMPGDKRLFKLLAPFGFSVDGIAAAIPLGFVTDLASIPDAAGFFMTNNDPRILRPALVHDLFYQYAGRPPEVAFSLTRAQADAMLRDGMAFCGAGWFARWTVWFHVRLYGMFSWKPHNAQVRALVLRSRVRQCNQQQPK